MFMFEKFWKERDTSFHSVVGLNFADRAALELSVCCSDMNAAPRYLPRRAQLVGVLLLSFSLLLELAQATY